MKDQMLLIRQRFSAMSNKMSNTNNSLYCNKLFDKCTLIVTNSYYLLYILFYISLLCITV